MAVTRKGGLRPLDRVVPAACGLLGVVALAVYFGAAPPLPPPDAGAAEVAGVGLRYHGTLFLGAWLQATGTLLCVVFFVALVQLAGGATRPSGLLTVVGAGTLLAVAVVEGAFTVDWAQAAADGHPAVALSSYEVMSAFVHVFPMAPAPLVYLSLGAALAGSDVLPRRLRPPRPGPGRRLRPGRAHRPVRRSGPHAGGGRRPVAVGCLSGGVAARPGPGSGDAPRVLTGSPRAAS
jgi:hypothetical protein